MEYQEYLGIKQEMYEHFMSLIEDENDIEEDFEEIIKIIQKAKCQEISIEFKGLLHLISELDKNHHRSSTLFTKIEGILFHYSEYIKRSFTNEELLNVFSKNQRILHFLIKKNIIAVDDSMTKLLHKKHHPEFVIRQYPGENKPNYESEKAKYYAKTLMYEDYKYYFYLDVKSTLSEKERSIIEEELLRKDENIFDNFEKKCEIGENDSYISFLIRKDMIPSSVTSIGNYAFSGCSSLTSITIPSSVTSIGDGAFCQCSSLTSITIPSSVTSIGNYAFSGCSSLTSITIPSSVTSIGDGAFCQCSSLTSITIPSSVTSIGNYAFCECSSLTSITIPSTFDLDSLGISSTVQTNRI